MISNSPNFDLSNPNVLLELERAKRFYQWSKKSAQELLDSPEKWQQLSDALQNPYFDRTWLYLRNKHHSELTAYLLAVVRYRNKIGAWMNAELCSAEERYLVESTWRALASVRISLPNLYQGAEINYLMIESIDPQGIYFVEHEQNSFSFLTVALKAGWKCRLRLDNKNLSCSTWINLSHVDSKGDMNVIPSTAEFSSFSWNPNNDAQRHFSLLGWLPFGDLDLKFHIKSKERVAQTVADVTRYFHQMLEDLNTYLPEPPVDAQSVFSQRSGDS